jgi:predicted N-acyltransferase
MNRFHHVIFSRLEELGENQWNQLATGESFYLSYPWLQTYPGSDAYTPFYILVLDENETPAAAIPCYLVRNPDFYAPYNVYDLFFRNLPDVCRKDCFPMLLFGTRSSYVNGVLWNPRLSMQQMQEVGQAIRSAVAELIEQWNARLVAFLYLTQPAAQSLVDCRLLDKPFVVTAANCRLMLDFPDFDSYLDRFRSRRRWDIRRQVRRFEMLGYEVKRLRLSECKDMLAPLFLKLQHRYGHQTTRDSAESMFSNQMRWLNELSLVYLCLSNNHPVGFCLFFRWKQSLYARVAGFDYDRLQNDFCYFNVVYYLPIMDALREGMREIHYGTTAYEAKIKRGCLLEPAWSTLYQTEFWKGPDTTSQLRSQGREKIEEWTAQASHWGLKTLDHWRIDK